MFKKNEHTIFAAILLIVDVCIINCSFLLSYFIRFYTVFEVDAVKGIPGVSAYVKVLVPITVLYIIILERHGLYEPKWDPFHLDEIKQVIKSVTLGCLILMASTFFIREFSYSRGVVITAYGIALVSTIIGRIIIRHVQASFRKQDHLLTRLLVVGTGPGAQRIFNTIKANPALGYKVVGFLTDDSESTVADDPDMKILGNLYNLERILEERKVQDVIVSLPNASRQKIVQIMFQCEKALVKFRIVSSVFENLTSAVVIEEFGPTTLLGMKESPLRGWNCFLKRAIDIVSSGLGLIILSPFFLTIAVLIKRDSPGPVFFKQERMELDGRVFAMYKFRSMRVNAEHETGPTWAQQNDHRRTRIGGWLRENNLDELPQLYNVFKGDMSLVGPRPERPVFVEKFKEQIPTYMSRHKVKAGITGWAQVHGLRGNTSLDDRIKFDLYYVENWSLMLDVRILLMTFFAKKNAY